jgi:predicted transcriptional regulator
MSAQMIDSETRRLLESLGGELAMPTSEMETKAIVSSKEGNVHTTGKSTSIEERALNLLGSGIQTEAVASALGVSASRVSQLLSQEEFATKVAALRYENLQAHNRRDSAYDSLEDDLLAKLKKSLPLMVKPDTILKAINIVNSAKRRGQSAPEQVTNSQRVVNLTLPTVLVHQFTVTANNQVASAGDQELQTIQSSSLLRQVEEKLNAQKEPAKEALTHEQESPP